MGADNASTGYCMPLNKASSASNGLHLVKLWAKEVSWKPSNITGYWQDY